MGISRERVGPIIHEDLDVRKMSQNISSAKIRWKISHLNFLGSRRYLPHWLSSKRPNYQRGVLLISVGAIEGHFEEKTPQGGKVIKGVLFLHDNVLAQRELASQRNWPTWASSILINNPILRIWLRRTTTGSLDWKRTERSPFFFRHGGHCCRGDLVGRTTFWTFFE